MSEQNFVILDDEFILTQIEEILVEVSTHSLFQTPMEGVCDLTRIKSLSDSDFDDLFDYLLQFQDLKKVRATFSPSVVQLPMEKVSNRVRILGKSPIDSLNYLMFFFVCFIQNKDALKKIFENEIKEDEFGVKSHKNWDRKFVSFFENRVFTENIFIFHSLSHKDFYEEYSTLNQIFKNIREFYLITSEQYSRYLKRNVSGQKEAFTTKTEKGISLELECAEILRRNKWQPQLTPKSGDQGADIIAQKGKMKLVVQCKNYESAVGNDAVQQIIAAKSFFDATIAAVVSKSGFTKSAIQLAEKTNVLLLSLTELDEI